MHMIKRKQGNNLPVDHINAKGIEGFCSNNYNYSKIGVDVNVKMSKPGC